MYDSLFGKISKLISVLFIALLSLHIVADYNFNKNWHLNTEKDREFTQDTMYLLKNNSEVYDLQADGIWRIRLSDLDTLFAPGKNTSFYSPPLDTSAKFYIEADQKTKEIYQKLITVYDVYDPPFSVPYSM